MSTERLTEPAEDAGRISRTCPEFNDPGICTLERLRPFIELTLQRAWITSTRRKGEGLLFDLRLIWCEGRCRPPHSQKAL